MVNFDKFLASFITEMKKYQPVTCYNLPGCIKKALEDQGLEYKDGEIVKTQRKVSAEAKENDYSESEEERIRKSLIRLVHLYGGEFGMIDANTSVEKALTWLEKQADVNLKEYVFRPLAGCDINTAAIQAVEQQKLGKKIILAFNGAYIPIEEKTADDIVNEYYSWLEKQGNPNTEYWKGYKDGKKTILDKYSELEKQGQNPAWSEEEEDAIGMAIIALEDMYDEDEPNTTYGGYNLPFNKAAERLKSLKQRHAWKPSKEQIDAMQMAVSYFDCSWISKEQKLLESLYKDLKKL